MKLHELIKIIDRNQDEITIYHNRERTYEKIDDIPITYCNYEVNEVYGYNASGYDGIMISITEE